MSSMNARHYAETERMDEDMSSSRKRRLSPQSDVVTKRRVVSDPVKGNNYVTVLTARRTPRRIKPVSVPIAAQKATAISRPSLSPNSLAGGRRRASLYGGPVLRRMSTSPAPFRSPMAVSTRRVIRPTPVPTTTPECQSTTFHTPAIRRAPRSPIPEEHQKRSEQDLAVAVHSPVVRRKKEGTKSRPSVVAMDQLFHSPKIRRKQKLTTSRPSTEPNRAASAAMLTSPQPAKTRRRSDGGAIPRRPTDLEVEVLVAGTVPSEWRELVASFFRVPDGWDARDYFAGCTLSQLTGKVEGGRRVMLGAAATENFEGQDQIYKSIVHAYIVDEKYRGLRLGEEFWAMLGEEFDIPVCAYIKLSEAEAEEAGSAMTKLAGEEGLPAKLLAALLQRSSADPGLARSADSFKRVGNNQMDVSDAPAGGTEAQKEEFIERFDSLPEAINERISLEIRRILRDPSVDHPGGGKANGAAKFWEKLGFEMDPRIFGLVGGDLVVGMSLGYF